MALWSVPRNADVNIHHDVISTHHLGLSDTCHCCDWFVFRGVYFNLVVSVGGGGGMMYIK